MFQPRLDLNLQRRFSVCACMYVCACTCTRVCVCTPALGDHSAHLTAISGAPEYHGGCYLTLHPCLISSPALGTSFLTNMFKIPFLD